MYRVWKEIRNYICVDLCEDEEIEIKFYGLLFVGVYIYIYYK